MIELIPAIDIIEGKCVRLAQGDYTQKTIYSENPVEVAKKMEAIGIKRLHLVDLDGAKKGEVVNLNVLEKIASQTRLTLDFGGGIRNDLIIERVFNSGASIATIGTLAVKQPGLFFNWIQKYGTGKILLGADVKNEQMAINGWLKNTNLNVYDFLKLNSRNGAKNIFCTDISKDGLLKGPSVDLYKKIIVSVPGIHLIASGGVSGMKDILELEKAGCKGVIIGKAIYEGRITLNELKNFNYAG